MGGVIGGASAGLGLANSLFGSSGSGGGLLGGLGQMGALGYGISQMQIPGLQNAIQNSLNFQVPNGLGAFTGNISTPGYSISNAPTGATTANGTPIYGTTIGQNLGSVGQQLFSNLPAISAQLGSGGIMGGLYNAQSVQNGQLADAIAKTQTGIGNYTNLLNTANNNYLSLLGLPQLSLGGGGGITGGTLNGSVSPILSPLQAIENARQSSVSTLSDSLAQRGVLGSSFGGSQLAGMNNEFANTAAQTALSLANQVGGTELGVANQLGAIPLQGQQQLAGLYGQTYQGQLQLAQGAQNLISQQQSIAQTALQTELQQLAQATGAASSATSQLNQNNQFMAQLAATVALQQGQLGAGLLAGQGALIGYGSSQLPGALGNIGTGLSNLFGSGNSPSTNNPAVTYGGGLASPFSSPGGGSNLTLGGGINGLGSITPFGTPFSGGPGGVTGFNFGNSGAGYSLG